MTRCGLSPTSVEVELLDDRPPLLDPALTARMSVDGASRTFGEVCSMSVLGR
jgi:hypothetical protein